MTVEGVFGWRYHGQRRPPFAVEPGPGQESVWDYPRPPRIEHDDRDVVVRAGAVVVARTRRACRVLETASPPTFYLPPSDVNLSRLRPAPGSSDCEWKGTARYWSVDADGTLLASVGWSYDRPLPVFHAIAGWLSFYPGRIECYVNGARVQPQPGGFYGGWLTPEIVGPVKGAAGSQGW